jgi:hypothetical protein
MQCAWSISTSLQAFFTHDPHYAHVCWLGQQPTLRWSSWSSLLSVSSFEITNGLYNPSKQDIWGGFLNGGTPKSSKSLDHVSSKTHGALGISHFQKPKYTNYIITCISSTVEWSRLGCPKSLNQCFKKSDQAIPHLPKKNRRIGRLKPQINHLKVFPQINHRNI